MATGPFWWVGGALHPKPQPPLPPSPLPGLDSRGLGSRGLSRWLRGTGHATIAAVPESAWPLGRTQHARSATYTCGRLGARISDARGTGSLSPP